MKSHSDSSAENHKKEAKASFLRRVILSEGVVNPVLAVEMVSIFA